MEESSLEMELLKTATDDGESRVDRVDRGTLDLDQMTDLFDLATCHRDRGTADPMVATMLTSADDGSGVLWPICTTQERTNTKCDTHHSHSVRHESNNRQITPNNHKWKKTNCDMVHS